MADKPKQFKRVPIDEYEALIGMEADNQRLGQEIEQYKAEIKSLEKRISDKNLELRKAQDDLEWEKSELIGTKRSLEFQYNKSDKLERLIDYYKLPFYERWFTTKPE